LIVTNRHHYKERVEESQQIGYANYPETGYSYLNFA